MSGMLSSADALGGHSLSVDDLCVDDALVCNTWERLSEAQCRDVIRDIVRCAHYGHHVISAMMCTFESRHYEVHWIEEAVYHRGDGVPCGTEALRSASGVYVIVKIMRPDGTMLVES